MKKTFKPFPLLRVARVSAGFMQEDLAKRIGRSPAFVSRIETGGPALITKEVASKIAKALNLPPSLVLSATRRYGPNDQSALCAAIRAAGLNQRNPASQLTIGEPELSAVVRGRRVPNQELAEKIAWIVGVPVEQLFPDRDREAS